MMNKNSMFYWYPKTKTLDIPQPDTVLIPMKEGEIISDGYGIRASDELIARIKKENRFQFPLFMRTDLYSAKHSWEATCFVINQNAFTDNIQRLVETSDKIYGLLIDQGFALREYIEMKSIFNIGVWGNMPVSKERRYMVEDGKVISAFPYWYEAVIDILEGQQVAYQYFAEKGLKPEKPDFPDNWRQRLKTFMHDISHEDYKQQVAWAEEIGQLLGGYWSVDFCQSKRGNWYFIDCALGEESWQPVSWYISNL